MLELFAGTRSVGKIAEQFGMRVFSLDYDPRHKCELTMDLFDFCPGDFPDIRPDIIWASPDCTSFSFASSGFHRDKYGNPKTEKAILGDNLLKKTLSLLEDYVRRNPEIVWYLENPRGYMAKRPYMIDWMKRNGGYEHLITYCSYVHRYRKPTNIWTNNPKWIPRTRCGYKFVDSGVQIDMFPETLCSHEMVNKNSNGGISGIGKAGDPRRSVIPEKLIFEILLSTPNTHLMIDEFFLFLKK